METINATKVVPVTVYFDCLKSNDWSKIIDVADTSYVDHFAMCKFDDFVQDVAVELVDSSIFKNCTIKYLGTDSNISISAKFEDTSDINVKFEFVFKLDPKYVEHIRKYSNCMYDSSKDYKYKIGPRGNYTWEPCKILVDGSDMSTKYRMQGDPKYGNVYDYTRWAISDYLKVSK